MTDQNVERKRSRSPGYPNFSLREAIRKAELLYRNDKRNPVPVAIAAEHWGYSPTSSAVLLGIATLKKFGLLEEIGGGASRLVKLTDLSLHILLSSEDAEGRQNAVREAALKPQIHAELWQQYGRDLPSDGNLKRILIIEKGFNDAAASDLIREYRDTISFAGVTEGDSISVGESDDRPTEDIKMLPAPVSTPISPAPAVVAKPQNLRRYAFPLADSPDAELFLPSPLTADNYDLLKSMVETFLAMSKPALVQKTANRPTEDGPASD